MKTSNRKGTPRACHVLATILLLTLVAMPSLAREKVSEDWTESFAGVDSIDLSNTNGHLTFEVWDRDEIEVRATKTAHASSTARANELLEAIEILVDVAGAALVIETNHPSSSIFGWLRGSNGGTSVNYVVKLPASARLAARSTNGHVNVDGVQGGVECRSTNGHVVLTDVGGPVIAKTTNGKVNADVVVVDGPIELASTNGSLEVNLPAGVGADLSARTTNGRVRIDGDIDATVSKRTKVEGRLAGGGDLLELRTVNGSIKVAAGGVRGI